MLRHCLLAAGMAVASIPAAAAPRESKPFTGLHVEALAGYENAPFDSYSNANGLLYGAGLGYDIGWKALRFGIEAEASGSNAETCFYLLPTGSVCQRTGRDLYLGGRFGGEVSRGVLLYAKAGYSDYRQTTRYSPELGSLVLHPRSDGFRIGAGAEFTIGRRAFVKAEYRFSNYERSFGFNRNQSLVGFGFRF